MGASATDESVREATQADERHRNDRHNNNSDEGTAEPLDEDEKASHDDEAGVVLNVHPAQMENATIRILVAEILELQSKIQRLIRLWNENANELRDVREEYDNVVSENEVLKGKLQVLSESSDERGKVIVENIRLNEEMKLFKSENNNLLSENTHLKKQRRSKEALRVEALTGQAYWKSEAEKWKAKALELGAGTNTRMHENNVHEQLTSDPSNQTRSAKDATENGQAAAGRKAAPCAERASELQRMPCGSSDSSEPKEDKGSKSSVTSEQLSKEDFKARCGDIQYALVLGGTIPNDEDHKDCQLYHVLEVLKNGVEEINERVPKIRKAIKETYKLAANVAVDCVRCALDDDYMCLSANNELTEIQTLFVLLARKRQQLTKKEFKARCGDIQYALVLGGTIPNHEDHEDWQMYHVLEVLKNGVEEINKRVPKIRKEIKETYKLAANDAVDCVRLALFEDYGCLSKNELTEIQTLFDPLARKERQLRKRQLVQQQQSQSSQNGHGCSQVEAHDETGLRDTNANSSVSSSSHQDKLKSPGDEFLEHGWECANKELGVERKDEGSMHSGPPPAAPDVGAPLAINLSEELNDDGGKKTENNTERIAISSPISTHNTENLNSRGKTIFDVVHDRHPSSLDNCSSTDDSNSSSPHNQRSTRVVSTTNMNTNQQPPADGNNGNGKKKATRTKRKYDSKAYKAKQRVRDKIIPGRCKDLQKRLLDSPRGTIPMDDTSKRRFYWILEKLKTKRIEEFKFTRTVIADIDETNDDPLKTAYDAFLHDYKCILHWSEVQLAQLFVPTRAQLEQRQQLQPSQNGLVSVPVPVRNATIQSNPTAAANGDDDDGKVGSGGGKRPAAARTDDPPSGIRIKKRGATTEVINVDATEVVDVDTGEVETIDTVTLEGWKARQKKKKFMERCNYINNAIIKSSDPVEAMTIRVKHRSLRGTTTKVFDVNTTQEETIDTPKKKEGVKRVKHMNTEKDLTGDIVGAALSQAMQAGVEPTSPYVIECLDEVLFEYEE